MISKTCFLVDDDDDDREFFTTALCQIDDGIYCFTARNGIDALQKLNQEQKLIPDFIFIDLNMPFINGTECLREIKKIKRLRDVPVIMYSTSMSDLEIEETRRLGAAGFISKPNTMHELRACLEEFFTQYPLNTTAYEN